jgi:hypothetical protein
MDKLVDHLFVFEGEGYIRDYPGNYTDYRSWKEDKEGSKWCDEYRIRDGHTKLDDGSWVTIHKVTTFLEKMKQDTIEVYDNYQDALKNNSALKKQRYEMEFGLRHAQKSLSKALAMKGDSDE